MSKRQNKPPKYPCGECNIGVRYSAIQCTGICTLWFHGACVNITDKRMKQLKPEEINSWTCKNCSNNPTKLNENSEENNYSTLYSLDDVQVKIQNAEEADLETSLSLAAEAGNALLAENNKLRKDLHELTLKNSQLAQRICNTSSEIKYQLQIDELKNRNETLTNRITSLTETINHIENQLSKEKQLRSELEQIFDAHDKEKEQILNNQEKEILRLQGIIKQLKMINSTEKDADEQTQPLNSTRNSETQTTGIDTQNHYSPILLQLAELKIRQDQTERHMIAMQEQLNKQGNTEQIMSTIPRIVSRVLNTPKTLSNGPPTRNPRRGIEEKKNNQYSVSLQMKKMKTNQGKIKSCTERITTKNDSLLTNKQYGILKMSKCPPDTATKPEENEASPKNILKIPKTPPLNSKQRAKNETYEEFFSKHIEFFKNHTVKHYGYLSDNNSSQLSLPAAISPHKISDQQPLTTVELVPPMMHSTSNDLLHHQKHFLDHNLINNKIK